LIQLQEISMHTRLWFIAFCAALVHGAAGQAPTLVGPQVGLLVDSASGSVRPVQGILGGATIGPPLAGGVSLSGGVASPRGDYVLGIGVEDQELWLAQPGPVGFLSAAPVPAAMRAADRIVLSPAGSHALLFNVETRSLQVLSGLPLLAAVSREIDLSSVQGLVTALAVSEDGNTVMVALSGETEGFLYRFTPQEFASPVTPVSRISAMAFSRAGDVVAADAGANAVMLIRDAAASAIIIPLAGQNGGIDSPVGVGISEDGTAAYVANAGSGSVMILDLAGGAPQSIPCPCSLTTLQPVGAGAFRLTDALNEAVWFLDVGATGPRVAFVPPPQAAGRIDIRVGRRRPQLD
jgi:hypothetical protein